MFSLFCNTLLAKKILVAVLPKSLWHGCNVPHSTGMTIRSSPTSKGSIWSQIFSHCESGMIQFTETWQFILEEDLAFLKSESFQGYVTWLRLLPMTKLKYLYITVSKDLNRTGWVTTDLRTWRRQKSEEMKHKWKRKKNRNKSIAEMKT